MNGVGQMKLIKWWSNAGFAVSDRSGVIEVEDSATESEIEEDVRDAVFNHFSWGWSEADADQPAKASA